MLLLKTRTSWCWNFFRKAQHPRIALLLSALDFVVMFSFDKRVCFSLKYWSRATQYFWHTFPLFFVKHDCSYKYSAHFCVLITALYMIRRITLIIQRLNHSFSRTVVLLIIRFHSLWFVRWELSRPSFSAVVFMRLLTPIALALNQLSPKFFVAWLTPR